MVLAEDGVEEMLKIISGTVVVVDAHKKVEIVSLIGGNIYMIMNAVVAVDYIVSTVHQVGTVSIALPVNLVSN